MNIRFSENSDIPRLKQIWKICFGDSDKYINFFFDNMFKPENAVVAVCKNEAVGVVHMLNASYDGRVFKYGYAIGVLPKFRGNSLCEKMHEFIKKYCDENGYMYGLHPANDKLSVFYKSIGLKEMYSLKTIENLETEENESFEICDICEKEYFDIREKICKPLISWDINTIAYMMNEAKHFGGFPKKIIIDGKEHIVLVKKYEDSIIVKETTMSDNEILRANNFLKSYFNAENASYNLSLNSELTDKFKTTIYGFNEKNNNIYMNLYFD